MTSNVYLSTGDCVIQPLGEQLVRGAVQCGLLTSTNRLYISLHSPKQSHSNAFSLEHSQNGRNIEAVQEFKSRENTHCSFSGVQSK